MKLLVTGGMGFIGSAVVRQAVREGIEVINLDAMTYAAYEAEVEEATVSFVPSGTGSARLRRKVAPSSPSDDVPAPDDETYDRYLGALRGRENDASGE